MSRWLDQPTFLCGHRKSGTTLLLGLFDSHPQLCVFPPDSGFFYAWYPEYEGNNHGHDAKVERIIDVMFANFQRDLQKLDSWDGYDYVPELAEALRIRMQCTDATPSMLLRTAIAAYHDVAHRSDSSVIRRWVEKTTSTEVYASTIAQWYPAVRFIHLIRDPRDNFASLKSGWASRYHEHNDSVERLLQSQLDRGGLGLKLALLNAQRFGNERYRVIRYEDLVTNPRPILEDLCNFLGIDFDPVLLRPSYFGLPWPGNNFDGLTFNAPSSVNVNRWCERIDEHEAQVIEFHLGDVMRQWGYEPYYSSNERIDAAMRHYMWHNRAQLYAVNNAADTYATEAAS